MLCKKGVWEEATKTNYLGDCTSDRAGAFWLSDEADDASQGISECLAITYAASGACTRYFEYDYDIPYSAQNLSTNPKTDGFGVRCVKELL